VPGLGGRLARSARSAWPAGAPGWVLLGLIAVGLALRILADVGSWPVITTLDDGYQVYAKTGPFMDPQHPAGYALIIGAVGAVTREVAVQVLLQQLAGIVSALLLAAATRRVTGSAWAGLLPAAMILLGADQIFLEHAVMSESWEVLLGSLGLYAAVRSIEPSPAWCWPLIAGVALALAVTVRSAALLGVAVALVAIAIGAARRTWRPALLAAGSAAAVLIAFAGAGAAFGPRFGIAPSPGWYLYGRVAQFADCHRFTPPTGTAFLCDRRPASARPTGYDYMFDPRAAASRHFGRFGTGDNVLGGWARRALLAQPGDFLSAAWTYLAGYFVPGSLPKRISSASNGLDPQLDFTYANVFFAPAITRDLEAFYDSFAVHRHHWALALLHFWQRAIRFGATLLFVTTILTLIGLFAGERRSRLGVLLFGVGGLSLLVAPALTGTYSGRYTVPMAGALTASAAIALHSLWAATGRRRGASAGPGA
jgi:hypothetical protein